MVRPLVLAPLAALALSACVVAPGIQAMEWLGRLHCRRSWYSEQSRTTIKEDTTTTTPMEIGASPRQGQAHGLISPGVTTPERSGTTNVVTNGWASAAVVVGAGLVVVLVAWIVQVRRRNRQRTRMLEMRGSALW